MNGFFKNDSVEETTIFGNLVKVVVHNALSITDTTSHWSGGVDVSDAQSIAISVTNTHNQSIDLILSDGSSPTSQIWAGDKTNGDIKVTIPASMIKTMFITQTDWPILKYVNFVNLNAKATSTAPTSGSITTTVIKRK